MIRAGIGVQHRIERQTVEEKGLMRFYRRSHGSGQTLLVEDHRRRCPECRHLQSEDGDQHFPDCRFFTLDDEPGASEDDPGVLQAMFSSGCIHANPAI